MPVISWIWSAPNFPMGQVSTEGQLVPVPQPLAGMPSCSVWSGKCGCAGNITLQAVHNLLAMTLTWSAKSSALPRNSRWFCMVPAEGAWCRASPRLAAAANTDQLAGKGTKNNNNTTITFCSLSDSSSHSSILIFDTGKDVL